MAFDLKAKAQEAAEKAKQKAIGAAEKKVTEGASKALEGVRSKIGSSDLNPRLIENNDKALVKTRTSAPQDALATVLDRDWMKRSFMVSDAYLDDKDDRQNRYLSSADLKFTDTRLGRNIGVNSRPQFTRYSDIRRKGRLASRTDVSTISTNGNFGMGRYYSEAIDDTAQTIYLRFGVPEYSSILDFLSRAFDPEALHLAKTGRTKTILFKIGQTVGGYVGITAFPQMAAIMFIGKIANTIFSKPRYKYYTLKPAMHNYWSCVNLLVNTIAVNLKLMPKLIADEKLQLIGKPFKLDYGDGKTPGAMQLMAELLPGIIDESGYIDVFAVANQAQMAANKTFLEEYNKIDTNTQHDFKNVVKKEGAEKIKTPLVDDSSLFSNESTGRTLDAFMERYTMVSEWFKTKEGDDSKGKTETTPTINPDTGKFDEAKAKDKGAKATYWQYLDAEFRAGSQFAVFKVNYTQAPSESFTNSVKESEISQKINSTVSQIRDVKFSAGQFQLPGAAGEAAGAVASGIGDVLTGALSGVTFGMSDAIASLLSNSYVDIPKHWQSSDVQLPKANYSMTLISPYGNPISLLQNIYIPLSMMLAGALPLAGGRASYTSPFICELFDRGKIQIRLGMIESLTITRGTSNLGYSLNNKPLAIDVSMSIVDLSSIMSMPVSPAGIKDAIVGALGAPAAAVGGALGTYNPAIDEDSILSDYLAVLTGLDIYSQIYALPKAKLNMAKTLIKAKALSSPAAWAMLTNESATSGILSYTPVGWFQFLVDGTRPPASIMADAAK
jgi:hypothetical protein